MKRTYVVGSIVAALLVGCGGESATGGTGGGGGANSTGTSGDGGKIDAAPTWHHDIKPIFDVKCASCHFDGGIAPFKIDSYADVQPWVGLIKQEVVAKTMPPWPVSDACNEYWGDRSLSDEQIDLIARWVDAEAPEGDPKDVGKPIELEPEPVLSRVDLTLKIAEPYTAKSEPDDYRCFVLDWPANEVQYVTGFRANPGEARVVHHVIAFLASPDDVAKAQAKDAAEEGPGYTCFGGSGVGQSPWIGAWAPGSPGVDYPAGTGIKVEPGSKVILQVHYNTLTAGKLPDQTSIDFKIDAKVDKEAHIQPWANPSWLSGDKMKIPAFEKDVKHSFAVDPTLFISGGKPFTIHSASLHMHQLGVSSKMTVQRKGGAEECLIDIPQWNFHWQGSYGLKQTMVFNPGDKMYLECHWDNSMEHQPVIDGKQQMPKDVAWGEGTTDEMCLGGFYMTVD